MSKLLIALLGATFASGAALAQTPTQQSADTKQAAAAKSNGTYYWLHPRLGMVKVDRATNFMVVAKRGVRGEPKASAAISR
jgi:hypothetical protein